MQKRITSLYITGKVNKEFSRESIIRFDIMQICKKIVKMMSKKFSNSLFFFIKAAIVWPRMKHKNLPELLALKYSRKGFRCKRKQRLHLYNNVKKT